jgi:hypothetical protein
LDQAVGHEMEARMIVGCYRSCAEGQKPQMAAFLSM